MDKLVLGVATLALSAGAASAQALFPSYGYEPYGYGYTATAPLYDYAGPASATPHGYGPLIYTPRRRPRSPAITQRSQWWFRSRYMTTHPVIGRQRQTAQHLSRLELFAITATECTW